ncbi:hypothetical protein ARALYDRAFT_334446 [Arabidopsis lyrata subsp. lyrata]|uniref:Uncharacterized protein n=1 Tax=Arabidopsis lyrata subsp. lyrata TaxID=81972 RepID=D7KMF7_ARALL|nr:hypothetical protein ARALYDRAFT_334446 [Arabidopsis lyrata subsp. lyrata]
MTINLVPLLLSIITIFNPTAIADQNQILNATSQWLHFPPNLNESTIKFSIPTIIAAVLSFFAASISSAGGGALFLSIMTTISGLEMKTASSFSAFMITGVSIANVGCNLFARNPKSRDKTLIDFDLSLTLQPCLLLGVSIGVICNRMFPNWLVLSLFAVFLAWSTMKTCKKGVSYWNLESEREKIRSRRDDDRIKVARSPLLANEGEAEVERGMIRFPWMKLGVLVIIWLVFFSINLFRGNKYGQGIISIKPCGGLYWFLSSLQIPLTIFFTLCICFNDNVQSNHTSHSNQDSEKVIAKYGRASIIVFAVGIVMALSTVLMTTHGALNVWNDFVSGGYMGFKLPC